MFRPAIKFRREVIAGILFTGDFARFGHMSSNAMRMAMILRMTAATGIVVLVGIRFTGAGKAGQQYYHNPGEQYDNKCDHLA